MYTELNNWVERTRPPEETCVSTGLTPCQCVACTDPSSVRLQQVPAERGTGLCVRAPVVGGLGPRTRGAAGQTEQASRCAVPVNRQRRRVILRDSPPVLLAV